jgi:hypothetical protein
MSWLLRIISCARWNEDSLDWLPEGDVPGDALWDLRTRENELSVWLVLPNDANLSRLVAALAGKRDKLDKFDYALLDSQVLPDIGVNLRQAAGESVDQEVAETLHYHVTNVSGSRLSALAKAFRRHNRLERVPAHKVALLIAQAVKQRWIKPARVKPDLAKKVEGNRKVQDLFPGFQFSSYQ